ncbi:MAG: response regulator [Phycisphaerales bacterium]|nr:MAG: response regulator [Phycisphaerales bacterium]
MDVGRRQILVVDADCRAVREVSALLAEECLGIDAAGSVGQAAEMIHDAKYDCVIMDVNLPDMKGYEAVPVLKTIDPAIQIIMTASENTLELEANVRQQDIFYYYIKSFDTEELREAVRDVFKRLERLKR